MSESVRKNRQTLQGKVVSNKMDKTAVVLVERTVMQPLYQRYIGRSNKFHAHDERNECQIGDEVVIVSCRPLSATKTWRVQKIVKRAGSNVEKAGAEKAGAETP